MIDWKVSIISGFIQGITEFLPVSSSGHLVVLHNIFKLPAPQLELDIVLHAATAGSIIFVFKKDFIKLLQSNTKMLFSLFTATLPAVVTVILFNKIIETVFLQLKLVGFGFLTTAFFLVFGSIIERKKKEKKKNLTPLEKAAGFGQCLSPYKADGGLKPPSASTVRERGSLTELTPAKAVFIGLAQALAVLPGFSRSGLTISTALAIGISREESVRFSFMLSTIAVCGACIFKIKELGVLNSQISYFNLIVSSLAAFAIGILAIKIVFRVVLSGKWHFFAIYCVLMSIFVFVYRSCL